VRPRPLDVGLGLLGAGLFLFVSNALADSGSAWNEALFQVSITLVAAGLITVGARTYVMIRHGASYR
jgi:hypothetical protein